MDLSRIILGPLVTEKAERGKEARTYTLRVVPSATKIDVKNALKRFYDIDVLSVRVLKIHPKDRLMGNGKVIRKRKAAKKMLVTLGEKSKPLDLIQFKTA